ncbi:Ultraviolet-B-repressible protein [Heracleum sosnowskyi]|uniref:Ultraviolet-B-repressible protein n=1 Tax=Heracleum sosnowskyi TaxID=360622 RepID=A0AAD8HUA9_9APIA|nr:Ultraviolet-B-repressible protein [Heracleum sosnowskyi]
MASVSMAMPLTTASPKNLQSPTSGVCLKPLPMKLSKRTEFVNSHSKTRLQVQASLKEKTITGLTATALTASMVMPDAASAASSLTPSLNNFLLSIGAGGVVLVAILVAVIGVSNFDPVKRA